MAGLAWVLHAYGRPALGLLERDVSGALLAGFLAVVGFEFAGYAVRWRILLEALGTVRGLFRLMAHRAAGQSVSSLIPSAKLGGEPLRVWLLLRDGVSGAAAIASVAVDRVLEMTANVPFAFLFATLLIQRGVPALQGAFVSVTIAAAAIVIGIVVAARRLRSGAGIVTAIARATGLDRLRFVQARMEVLGEAEEAARRLIAQPRRLGSAFGAGVAVNLLTLLEYRLLLGAFGLPDHPLAVVAAIFATGAAHSLPVPAAVGALEGAQMFLFGTMGHPPEVGLAVGLAVRVRELVWVGPGLLYLSRRLIVGSGTEERRDGSGRHGESWLA